MLLVSFIFNGVLIKPEFIKYNQLQNTFYFVNNVHVLHFTICNSILTWLSVILCITYISSSILTYPQYSAIDVAFSCFK